jgi:hypothetical protein
MIWVGQFSCHCGNDAELVVSWASGLQPVESNPGEEKTVEIDSFNDSSLFSTPTE